MIASSPRNPLARRALLLLTRVGAVALLLGMVLVGSYRAEAKLDPYYVLRGQSLASFKPRILIALDTSGSMAWLVSNAYDCDWENCEDGSATTASRLALARRAINTVVKQSGGQADFALMTFDHAAPPTSAGQVPPKCNDVAYTDGPGTGHFDDGRFMWVNEYRKRVGGSVFWDFIHDIYGGTRGTWMLCGGNRPFPYLRYDNALQGVTLPNDMTTNLGSSGEVLPQGPIAPLVTSWANYYNANNVTRKVQFFPQFLGQRVKLDCSDTEFASAVSRSYGDYGNGVTGNGQVCGQTWYYWPYVDGFPSYTYPFAAGTNYTRYVWSNRMQRDACDTVCVSQSCGFFGCTCTGYGEVCEVGRGTGAEFMGVADRAGSEQGTLWTPFYSEAAIAALTGDDRGPLNRTRANDYVLGSTAKMVMGGVDAAGGTPLSTLVGNVDTYVSVSGTTINPTGSFRNNNRAWGHDNMASYLSFIRKISPNDVCVPTYAILITDGEPSDGFGGSTLYSRLSKLRTRLDVKTYVVGFGAGVSFATVNNMACAAAGSSSSSSPCSGTPTDNWDTCRVASNPAQCGFPASDPQALADALLQIVDGAIETELPAGPVASANEFVTSASSTDINIYQTNIRGYTEAPEFKGHVTRSACDTQIPADPSDPSCADPLDPAYAGCALITPEYCTQAAALEPAHAGNSEADLVDLRETEDFALGGSTCSFSREWDAGECLQSRDWRSRRIYTYDASGNVFRISDDSGAPTGAFSSALISAGVAASGTEAAAITRYVLGQNLPDNWKLPGLSTSTPVVVRRIPPRNENFRPSVAIRDPHCSGRRLDGVSDVPASLIDFADDATTTTVAGGGLSTHREYQEAVLVGSDFGLLHAFHFDSGNELFALLPPSMYQHIATLQSNGPNNYGQVDDLANRKFGVSATINHGWAYDKDAGRWRHLTTVGMGPGGRDILALDISHMGRLGNSGNDVPVEVLWSSDTMPGVQGDLLRATLGETWSRPALTYKTENDDFVTEPEAYLVFASGYDEINDAGAPWRGQALHLVDAMTGRTYAETAYFPTPPASQMLEAPEDFAITMDPAVSSHCLSRYWAEAQEMYIADVAGRLYRWDLGSTGTGLSFDHEADSGTNWASNSNVASPLFRFGACLSTNEFSCSISGTVGDFFVYPPAVISSDRIDDPPPAPAPPDGSGIPRDQFLIAMVSGSINDDKVDGGDKDNPFHSSLYLLVDDHSTGPKSGGLVVDGAAGNVAAPGSNAGYMRLPLNNIVRERRWTYPDGSAGYENRPFSKRARPVKAPFIRASLPVGVSNSTGTPEYDFFFDNANIELYEIIYTIYEPGEQSCDPRWRNSVTNEWEFDAGATYEIRFLLAANDSTGFDFINGAGTSIGDLFGGGTGGLSGPMVTQIPSSGVQVGSQANIPCDPNRDSPPIQNVFSVPVGSGEVDGFSPREI